MEHEKIFSLEIPDQHDTEEENFPSGQRIRVLTYGPYIQVYVEEYFGDSEQSQSISLNKDQVKDLITALSKAL